MKILDENDLHQDFLRIPREMLIREGSRQASSFNSSPLAGGNRSGSMKSINAVMDYKRQEFLQRMIDAKQTAEFAEAHIDDGRAS